MIASSSAHASADAAIAAAALEPVGADEQIASASSSRADAHGER